MVAARRNAAASKRDLTSELERPRWRTRRFGKRQNWKDLIRPNRPVVGHERDAQRHAKLVIELLERGFARRSATRSAASAVCPGRRHHRHPDRWRGARVLLDPRPRGRTDIVLNLKRVAIRMVSDTPKRMTLKLPAQAPRRPARSKSSDVEILNPDHVIAISTGLGTPHRVHRRHRQGLCPATATVRMIPRSASSRSTRSSRRSSVSASSWKTPARARCSTMTNSRSTCRPMAR